jgi:hypothetical protein
VSLKLIPKGLSATCVVFRHAGDIANFAIAYEMQERNSPGSVRGELLVFIEVVAAGNVES